MEKSIKIQEDAFQLISKKENLFKVKFDAMVKLVNEKAELIKISS